MKPNDITLINDAIKIERICKYLEDNPSECEKTRKVWSGCHGAGIFLPMFMRFTPFEIGWTTGVFNAKIGKEFTPYDLVVDTTTWDTYNNGYVEGYKDAETDRRLVRG